MPTTPMPLHALKPHHAFFDPGQDILVYQGPVEYLDDQKHLQSFQGTLTWELTSSGAFALTSEEDLYVFDVDRRYINVTLPGFGHGIPTKVGKGTSHQVSKPPESGLQ